MANYNTESFTSGDMAGSGTNSKEVIYMSYILNTLSEARKSFDDGDTQRFNLYMSFLKNSILDKKTRDKVDKEMMEEETKLKKANYDDKYIEFQIGFVVVREIMAYINETLELSHDDIIGEVGRLDSIEEEGDIKLE
jgi:hypothetical protein